MKALIVKLSSMGDIIHTLPALTDAKKNIPQIEFDWLVEPAFSEIPAWHPAVKEVIPIALRAIKKDNLINKIKKTSKIFSGLHKRKYDIVIDAQGLVKSALLARSCRSKIYGGFSWSTIREQLASIFYNNKIIINRDMHIIYKIRNLFADLLGYKLTDKIPNYGIDWQNFPKLENKNPYVVFLHGTTWENKHWPEQYWIDLANIVGNNGYEVHLMWGNQVEKERAERLAKHVSIVKVLSKLNLKEVVSVLINAVGAVTVDTGIGHLASAIDIPVVALYGPSDPLKVWALGNKQVYVAPNISCAPCLKRNCKYENKDNVYPNCFAEITPQLVWEKFQNICFNNRYIP